MVASLKSIHASKKRKNTVVHGDRCERLGRIRVKFKSTMHSGRDTDAERAIKNRPFHSKLGSFKTWFDPRSRFKKDRLAVARSPEAKARNLLVGTGRFELPTPRTPSECSTRLSHVPTGRSRCHHGRRTPNPRKAAAGLTPEFYTTLFNFGAVKMNSSLGQS